VQVLHLLLQLRPAGISIDYRCAMKKKTLQLGRYLGIIAQLKTPGFQKCRSLTLFRHLFIRKPKITILHGLSSPNPNFSEFAFLGNRSAD
jgi:hypothetical protein